VATWRLPVVVVEGRQQRIDAFAAGTVALAASGTVALELALARLPTVIGYIVSPLTGFLARRLLKVKFVTLLNVVMGRSVMPEYLQENCRPDLLAKAVAGLLDDPALREAQLDGCGEALLRLGRFGPSPGLRAADAVLATIKERLR